MRAELSKSKLGMGEKSGFVIWVCSQGTVLWGEAPQCFGNVMSHKSAKIAALIADQQGKGWEAHYLGYFECFNQGLYYEAHDVLEEIWLPERQGAKGLFYKGLIQLAGAFVHFQKERMRPAGALLRLAQENLQRYPAMYEGIVISDILGLIEDWLERLARRRGDENPFKNGITPKLRTPESYSE